eukprot:CAMPEP_0197016904 /NCGR_PEP_ID=MMETSP1380-20130617/79236_1 /TAXON_ID=5936 /ORGANISM="Euplotes crassus, Strain CT5" /LENGTH=194 /DNA_ID=CAMNT_0042443929 /DNA_START=1276 /DNA_END=1856 /DNA_ORIENTATION=-
MTLKLILVVPMVLKSFQNKNPNTAKLLNKLGIMNKILSILEIRNGNGIKKQSEKESKYSQALKQVGDYEQDIMHLGAKKEYLERLIKEESRPSRKKKERKAEVTDVCTFMYLNTRITVRKNDLVQEYVDAIVNPANEDLNHAGGAAKAIASKAGPEFERECEDYISENYKLKTGSSMVTSAGGELKCDYVIHTV